MGELGNWLCQEGVVKTGLCFRSKCGGTSDYGGQQWTALCLVRAEQRQVVSGVLDNFYLEPILKFTQCDSKELQGGRSTLKT